jgi:uncharacterized RDD family membrane protein YckC
LGLRYASAEGDPLGIGPPISRSSMSTLPPAPPLNDPGQPWGQPVATIPYAIWIERVGATLIDAVPGIILSIIGRASTGAYVVCLILSLVFGLWNACYLQGKTGQSIGKRVLGIKLIKEQTGQPIGGWSCFGRIFVHIVDVLSLFLGYLWPLWDQKKQTFADKIMSTVVVKA